MEHAFRRLVACASILALVVSCSSLSAVAAIPGGRLEGRITAPDGRPASGWSVILFDAGGTAVDRSTTGPAGRFGFEAVAEGAYRLGLEDRAGRFAPVLGPAASVVPGGVVSRDVKLVATGGNDHFAQTLPGPQADSWWSRQTRNQKIFAIVGIVVGAALLVGLASQLGDDDEEPAASPSIP